MTVTYYVAITFTVTDDGTVAPGEAIECPSAETAILRAEVLSRIRGNVGAVAFSRTGDPDVGVWALSDISASVCHSRVACQPSQMSALWRRHPDMARRRAAERAPRQHN